MIIIDRFKILQCKRMTNRIRMRRTRTINLGGEMMPNLKLGGKMMIRTVFVHPNRFFNWMHLQNFGSEPKFKCYGFDGARFFLCFLFSLSREFNIFIVWRTSIFKSIKSCHLGLNRRWNKKLFSVKKKQVEPPPKKPKLFQIEKKFDTVNCSGTLAHNKPNTHSFFLFPSPHTGIEILPLKKNESIYE